MKRNGRFSDLLKQICTKEFIDLEKVKVLPESDKTLMVQTIVRHRHAVLKELVPETMISWLHSMGYLYTASNARFTFMCTSENMKEVKICQTTLLTSHWAP